MKSITGYSESSSRSLNLILGSHGLGWLLKPSSSYGAVDMMAQDVDGVVSSGSEGSIIADYEAIPDHLRMSRYMGVSSDGYTDIEELREAIDNSGIKFGYIIFDQCYMGSIELLYRLRDCCYYAVASPAEIMSTGFPYDTVLPALFENNGRDYNLQGVCEAYYEYYLTTNETLNCGCIAMCDMGELEALAEVVSRMSLTTLFEEDDLMGYDNYSLHRFYDFGDYIRSAGGDETSLLEEFNNQFDRAFPEECRLHTDKYFVSVNGIATPTIDAAAYSGVTTSDLARGLTDCVGWELEPWSIAAGRVDN